MRNSRVYDLIITGRGAGRGIRVNAIGPGATITPINRTWINDPEKSKMVQNNCEEDTE